MKKHKSKKVKKGKSAKKGGGYSWLAGGLVGAALGVGAGLLAESKIGKKLGKNAKHLSADFYRYMAPQIKKVKKMGEAEYKKFVAEAMKRYSKDRKLSQAEARHVVKEASAAWKHLKKNL
jgi:gas vesicle protein